MDGETTLENNFEIYVAGANEETYGKPANSNKGIVTAWCL